MKETKRKKDAFDWLYDRYVGEDPERIAPYEEERIKSDIAQQVYDLRNEAGLSQKELADLVGTTETVIDDLEESDYGGDALSMLIRISTLLNKRIRVQFVRSDASDSGGASV